MKTTLGSYLLIAGLSLFGWAMNGRAEVGEIRVAQQYGINYLQLMVMEDRKLIEKHAKRLGLGELHVTWSKMSSGAAMNDALLSGNLEIASGGIGPIVVLWAKTAGIKNGLEVKAVAAINSMPVVLTTRNPNVKTVKDFTDKDKIALPAVKVSIQAVTLQMAAAQAFGAANYAKLDPLTVSMSHPDGMLALVGGHSEVTAHFTGPPFSELELQSPGIHTVVHSYELLGGVTTSTLVWSVSKFRDENPRTFEAFLAALKEATDIINQDKRAAAELYLRVTKGKESLDNMEKILSDSDIEYTLTPKNVLKYARFMYDVGTIKVKPASWKDMFFSDIHALPGS